MLKEGLFKEKKCTVKQLDTALVIGSGDLDVLATPALVAQLENISMLVVSEEIEPHLTTVGSFIELKHLKPTAIGKTYTVNSQIIAIEGKKIVFKLEAYDAADLIAEGQHVRYIVDRSKFMEKLK